MDKNVGGLDRTGRILIGVIVAVAGIAAVIGYWEVGVAIGGVALVIGAILLGTGTTQKCPINQVAGIDTTEQGE